MRFPTVASAKAAGMILAGGMAPGVGAHYQLISGNVFKGINPDGSVNPRTRPRGFTPAANDRAGRGRDVRVDDRRAAFGVHRAERPLAQARERVRPVRRREDRHTVRRGPERDAAGVQGRPRLLHEEDRLDGARLGRPGWSSPQGVFSHDNLHVYCPGNTDLTDAIGFCDRQS